MNRFKNYGLWLAVASLALDVLMYSHVITVAQSNDIQALVQRGLEVLIVAGIINNPASGSGFKDEK
jgi:uncharacterized membrane protein